MASIDSIHNYGGGGEELCLHPNVSSRIIGESLGIIRSCTFYEEPQHSNTFFGSPVGKESHGLVPVDGGDLPRGEESRRIHPIGVNCSGLAPFRDGEESRWRSPRPFSAKAAPPALCIAGPANAGVWQSAAKTDRRPRLVLLLIVANKTQLPLSSHEYPGMEIIDPLSPERYTAMGCVEVPKPSF